MREDGSLFAVAMKCVGCSRGQICKADCEFK